MLAKVRAFFHQRNVLEVDVPCLSRSACVDAHIDLIPALFAGNAACRLHSSPEYGMKRLLAEGIGDIYQLSHVFRDGEVGHKHNPEFMMAEWYRVGMDFQDLMEETADFAMLFLGNLPRAYISYRQAFIQYAGFDYFTTSTEALYSYLQERELTFAGLDITDRDALLNLILGIVIEPQLGKEGLCLLCYYPSTQAALAQTQIIDGEPVAERFELYYKGVELANGYHELANAAEQRQRLIESNEHRVRLGKQELPIDENFLKALEQGLPDCCGVAVGFDRLIMLRHHAPSLTEVLPFTWQDA